MAEGLSMFPVFLRLEGRAVVVVGGGVVAAGRVSGLLGAGARVTVVAPEIRESIAAEPVRVVRRAFEQGDLDGAWLVVAAAPAAVNRQVVEAAEERRIFVNAVDDIQAATAYTGGVLRRGGVTIAVSTEGRAPALAGLLREGLEGLLPDDIDEWVAVGQRLRAEQRAAGVPMTLRRPALLEALNRLYSREPTARERTA